MTVDEEEEEGNPDDAAAEKSGTEVSLGWPWICHSQDPTPILISVALSYIQKFWYEINKL